MPFTAEDQEQIRGFLNKRISGYESVKVDSHLKAFAKEIRE
jgi:hypothetical protein